MTSAPELAWRTPAPWATDALGDPLALLSDHAHCELGAASSAQSLIARVPHDGWLVDRLSALAAEEMRHFRRVHRLLRSLGGALGPARRNPYTTGLLALVRRGEEGLLDRLLVAALVECRSHERFGLLAEHATTPLAELFRRLAPSEDSHARLFVDLAERRFPATFVVERLGELARLEASIARSVPPGARIHSGPRRVAESAESEDGRGTVLQAGRRTSERRGPAREGRAPCP